MPAAAAPVPALGGIGTRKERSLHAALKTWYAGPEDALEVPLGPYVIDIVRGELLIEIQTRNFAAIRPKLQALLPRHPVRLVHPLPLQKWIVQTDRQLSAPLSRRKSVKEGRLTDVFAELVRLPELLLHPHFSLEVLLTDEEEWRCRDGRGSRHRKGASLLDRRLLEVTARRVFSEPADFLDLLPPHLPQPFSNQDLARALQLPLFQARQMTYCLKKMQALAVMGKHRNELLFEIAGSA